MNKEEYKKQLKEQYEVIRQNNKEELEKKNKVYKTGIVACLAIGLVVMLLSMLAPLSTFLDFIFEIDGIALGILIIIAAYNAFRAMAYPKKTLSYLVEESVFQYKPTYAKKEVFMNNLCSYGFNSLFVRINDKVFCLDAKVKEPGKEGLENVSECRVNFSEPMNVEQFLNYNIDGLRICDIESFELLSINFDDPMNFITK